MKLLSRLVERTTASSHSNSTNNNGHHPAETEARLPLRQTAMQEEMMEDSYEEDSSNNCIDSNGGTSSTWYSKTMMLMTGTSNAPIVTSISPSEASSSVKTLQVLAKDSHRGEASASDIAATNRKQNCFTYFVNETGKIETISLSDKRELVSFVK